MSGSPSLSLSGGESIDFPYDGRTNEDITVVSSVNWSASEDADWLTLLPEGTQQPGSVKLKVTATENTAVGEPREATITVSGEQDVEPKTITVKQDAKNPTASFIAHGEIVEGNNYLRTIRSSAGTFDAHIQSNTSWTASVTQGGEWLTLPAEYQSGTASKSIKPSVTANTGSSPRVGVITCITTGTVSLTITLTVTQEGGAAGINDIKAALPVRTENGNLIVSVAPGSRIEVYTVAGSRLQSTVSSGNETILPGLPRKQILIVRSGSSVAKVVL
jgi:hypothetical protein